MSTSPLSKELRSSLALVTLAVLLTACGRDQPAQEHAGGPPPAAVSIAPVEVRKVAQWDEFTGRIEATDTVEIRPRVSGFIESVRFKEGGEVKKGDVLFVIDPRPYRAALDRTEAELAQARAQAALAKSEAGRAQRLLETKVISQEAHDQRLAAEQQANAAVQAAAAAVETARLNLDFTEVRSPINGRAGEALVTVGNLVQSDPSPSTLTTVVSLDPVYAVFEGDEQTYLRYGAMARRGERPSSRDKRTPVMVGLSNEDDFPHQGYVDFVDNQLNPATGTIRARAVLDNKERIFTPGLFARVKLLGSGEFPAVLVDDKAILTDQDRKYVYVLGPENRALRRDIKIGRSAEGLRIVTDGLGPEDQVIVHGVQKIFFPGMPVQAQTIRMGDPPPAPSGPGAPGGQ
ncbi:MAG: efflux RND transporter periplasmic adaptor subunit [Gammaproteobacteria bacterium]|nr:efflux RND transporter periplasmic adaptor subunit [Gammaproteobacteria bacterium]